MENREREESVDNPPAPVPAPAPAPSPAPSPAQALPQLPQGLPYYGATPAGYPMLQMPQQAGQLMPQQAGQLMPQQAAQLMPQQAAQLMPQQAAQLMPQQAAQLMPQQAAQLMLPQLQMPHLQQAVAAPYGGPSSPYQQAPQLSPFNAAVAGPSSPLVHLQPQHGTPARGGNRAPNTSNVTLPWEKRVFCGRPNMTDNMMKKLYEEGRIAPPPTFQAFHWQFPAPSQYAQPAAPVFFPAAAVVSVPQAAASVPQAAASVPQAAAVATAAAGPSGGSQSSSTGPRPECRFCRSDTPDGFLKCGHALCRACFARLKTNTSECPDPRCHGVLDEESYTGMKF